MKFLECKKEFLKDIDILSTSKHRRDVFVDFVYLASYALQNVVSFNQDIENKYLHIAQSYTKQEMLIFPKMLGLLIMALEDDIDDFLGAIYMEIEANNKNIGQFFTPTALCKLIAKVTFDVEDFRNKKCKVHEPALGSGAMILAFARELKENNISPSNMVLTAIETDSLVARMAYIQFFYIGLNSTILIGNALSLEIREELNTLNYV